MALLELLAVKLTCLSMCQNQVMSDTITPRTRKYHHESEDSDQVSWLEFGYMDACDGVHRGGACGESGGSHEEGAKSAGDYAGKVAQERTYIHGSVEESPSGERTRSLDLPGANTPRPWPRTETHQGSLCVNLRWATCDQHAAIQGMEGQTRTSTSRGRRIAQNRSANRSADSQLSEATRSSGAATDFGIVDKIFDDLSAKPSTVPFV